MLSEDFLLHKGEIKLPSGLIILMEGREGCAEITLGETPTRGGPPAWLPDAVTELP